MIRQKRNREDPAVRRAQILDEALRIIGEQGFHGFTIQQLSARCGMSNAGLLHYFASKDVLLAAVLAEIEARQVQTIAPLVAGVEALIAAGDASLADVRAFFRAVIARMAEEHALGPFLLVVQAESIDSGHPAHAYFQGAEDAAIALYERLLASYCADTHDLARIVHAMMIGLAQQWYRSGCTLDLLAIWDRAVDLLLPDNAAPPGRKTKDQ